MDGFLCCCWARTQPTVSKSSTEAELLALNMGSCEALHVQSILAELNEPRGVTVFSDNSGAILSCARRGMGRMRHLRTQELWLQEAVRDGRVAVRKIGTSQNPVDILTKCLVPAKFEPAARLIGLEFNVEQYEVPRQQVAMLALLAPVLTSALSSPAPAAAATASSSSLAPTA